MPLDTSQESGPKIFGTQTLTAGMLSALVAGSIVLFGRIYIPQTSTQTTIIQRGTGSVLTDWAPLSGMVCSNTGGLFKYNGCRAQNPETGTAVLLFMGVDFNKLPVTATQTTCVTSPDGTATGQVIFKYKPAQIRLGSTGSGASITASGNNLPLIPPSWYVRCWFDRTPGPGLKAKLNIVTRGQYIP